MTDDLEQLMTAMLWFSTDDWHPINTDPALCAQWVRDNLYDLIAACIEVDVEQTGPLEVTITSELPDTP